MRPKGSAADAERYYRHRMKVITVKLPDALAEWLARTARELGRPQSDLVREALQRRSEGAGAPNCHDLLADVCGTIDGPKDLSTHRKHMAGFGQ